MRPAKSVDRSDQITMEPPLPVVPAFALIVVPASIRVVAARWRVPPP